MGKYRLRYWTYCCVLFLILTNQGYSQAFYKFFNAGVFTTVSKDTAVRYNLDINSLLLQTWIKTLAKDTIGTVTTTNRTFVKGASSGLVDSSGALYTIAAANYDSYVFTAEDISPDASSTNDSVQLRTDGGVFYSHSPGLQYYIDRITLQSGSSTFYGATYSNTYATWGISADSSISITVRKAGSSYFMRVYKHPVASGLYTPISGGTLLYSEQISGSFFQAQGRVSLKAYTRIRRKY